MAKLIAIDVRGITKLSATDEIVIIKPLCKKKIAALAKQDIQVEFSAKEIHLLAIDDFCNNLIAINFFQWDSKEITIAPQFTSIFFTNLSSRYLTYHSPPPQS